MQTEGSNNESLPRDVCAKRGFCSSRDTVTDGKHSFGNEVAFLETQLQIDGSDNEEVAFQETTSEIPIKRNSMKYITCFVETQT